MARSIDVQLDDPLQTVHRELAKLSAASAAELFLSPFVEADFLNRATQEEGPSLWIVNRSDVYDETLETLSTHPVPGIAARAQEKLAARNTTLILLRPPLLEGPLEEVPEYQIEDVLGHPLVPFEAVVYFSEHPLEDYRASAALSLTRRVLEHRPNWNADLALKVRLSDVFGRRLLGDASALVRSYCARIPFLPESLIREAWGLEKNPLVRGRLLQNPAAPADLLVGIGAAYQDDSLEELYCKRVAAADRRYPRERRRELTRQPDDSSLDPLAFAMHLYHAHSQS